MLSSAHTGSPAHRGAVVYAPSFFRTDDALLVALRQGHRGARAVFFQRYAGEVEELLLRILGSEDFGSEGFRSKSDVNADLGTGFQGSGFQGSVSQQASVVSLMLPRVLLTALSRLPKFKGNAQALRPWLLRLTIQEAEGVLRRRRLKGLIRPRSWAASLTTSPSVKVGSTGLLAARSFGAAAALRGALGFFLGALRTARHGVATRTNGLFVAATEKRALALPLDHAYAGAFGQDAAADHTDDTGRSHAVGVGATARTDTSATDVSAAESGELVADSDDQPCATTGSSASVRPVFSLVTETDGSPHAAFEGEAVSDTELMGSTLGWLTEDSQSRSIVPQRAAYAVFDKIPVRLRIAFCLHYVAQLDIGEVAELCNVSLSAARRAVLRGKDRFLTLAKSEPELRSWL